MTASARCLAEAPIRHRAGALEVCLAAPDEIDAALRLRHRVFCEEGGARTGTGRRRSGDGDRRNLGRRPAAGRIGA